LIPQIYGHQATFNSSLAQIEFSKRQQVQHLQLDRQQYQNRQQKVVIINPGHGGNDTGGESLNGIREKDITLDLAKRIRRLCQEQKISVILTRIDDSDLRPSQRIRIATQHQGSFFLSLHCNMSFSTAVSGMEIWINNLKGQMRTQSQKVEKVDIFRPLLQDDYLEQSRQVAKIIQGRLGLLSNDVVQIRENPLAILSGIYMPALLLELGYLSNLKDEAKLQNEKTRETIAGAIADAIGQFLEQSEL
jgi:N-acetylmuramoyl-L-alanine amidase